MTLVFVLIVLISVPTPVRAQDTTLASALPVAAGGDFAGLVEIGGGRRLYLECRGTGGPTVVLVSGLGDAADVWMVTSYPDKERPTAFAGVATFTRVCAYDRPSTALRRPRGSEHHHPFGW